MTDPRQPWRVVPGQTLERREWDGEAVLFNDLTGATHLLSATSLWVLDRLRDTPSDAPLDIAALAQALQENAYDTEADDADEADQAGLSDAEPAELSAGLAVVLKDLHKMHLVEPC